MKEIIEVFDMGGKSLGSQEKKEFYDEIASEIAKDGSSHKQVKTVRLLLLNSSGRIYLQKRSKQKSENPGLYDKTVGGHVRFGESFDVAVIRECAEELGFPVAVLSNDEFAKAVPNTDLSIIGLFREVEKSQTFPSIRKFKDGHKSTHYHLATIYVGYYDGAIKFVDGESSGIEVFSLDELKEDIKNHPDKFTEDIKLMVNKYSKYLVPV